MTMTDQKSQWSSGVNQAMREIEGRYTPPRASVSIMSANRSLPNWFMYTVIGILILIALIEINRADGSHALSPDRDFHTGSRVALLMIAEDIERIRNLEGSVPDQLDTALGYVLDVEYRKLDDKSFVLQMNTDRGVLVFNDSIDSVELEGIN